MKISLFKSLLLALMLIFTGCSVEGTITDVNGVALENAKIVATYQGETQEVYSDADGYYSLDNLNQEMEVELVVSKNAYTTMSQTVNISKENYVFDFELPTVVSKMQSIKGRVVDDEGNPLNVWLRIYEYDTFAHSFDGTFRFHNRRDANKTIDFTKEITITISDDDMRIEDYNLTFNPADYVDEENPTVMDIGTIILHMTTIKGCVQNLDGSVYGSGYITPPEDDSSIQNKFEPGIAVDNKFGFNPDVHIYDDANGTFELQVFQDDREHILHIYDEEGNYVRVPLMIDQKEIDLGDSCIQLQENVSRDITLDVQYDSSISDPLFALFAVTPKGLYMGKLETLSDEEMQYTMNSNGEYIFILSVEGEENTSKEDIDYSIIEDQTLHVNILNQDFTLQTPKSINNAVVLISFDLYQGKISDVRLVNPDKANNSSQI